MNKFELVVPAYNEGKNLPRVIGRAIEAAKKDGLKSSEFSLIVVQNGSLDDSDDVLQKLKADPALADWFEVVRVGRNEGYGYGLWKGLEATSSPIVGWSHADQQCDPADAIKAFRMIEASKNPNALIKGERLDRNLRDRMVSRTFELIARIVLGINVREMNAQPKVFRRHLLKDIQNPPKTFAFDLYVLFKASRARFQITTIPVHFPSRIHGISNWASSFLSRYKTILEIIKYMINLRRKEGRA